MKLYLHIACYILIIAITPSYASVVLLNTRMVYPEGVSAQTIQLTNNDDIPYVMQMWTDNGNQKSTPNNADDHFVVLPALFRIEPKTGQSVRIVFNGGSVPQDRESVFYLNSVQIPPKNLQDNSKNKMAIILRNRIKIFYRPASIRGIERDSDDINFYITDRDGGAKLKVKNDSAFFVSMIDAYIIDGGIKYGFDVDMVSPKSEAVFEPYKKGVKLGRHLKIDYTIVNDYGGHEKLEKQVNYN